MRRTAKRLTQVAAETFGAGALDPRPEAPPPPPPLGAAWYWPRIERARRALRHADARGRRRRRPVRMGWYETFHDNPYPPRPAR